MIIIGGNSHPELAEQVAAKLKCDFISANTKKFANQELKVQISKNLSEKNVAILQSTMNPINDHLMELLLIADALKRQECNKITAIIPYFGYSRQDRPSYEYGPISVSLVAKLIEASGIDEVITIDMHSKQSEFFFKIRIKNLDPIDLFVSEFREKHKNYIVISPDNGGLSRAKTLALKLGADLIIMQKIRNHNGKCIMNEDIVGDLSGKDCIIVDDITDTGNTLSEAAKVLIKKKANSISVCITHAVFSDDCLSKIEQFKFEKFLITDTIPHSKLPYFVKIKSTADLIAKAIFD